MLSANQSGTFKFDATRSIHRLGFGTMRLTGPGFWGPPADRPEALRTLRRLRDYGVNFIDTADSYGPNFAEELIREALHPFGDILVATKGGFARTGPDKWTALGRPEYLIQQARVRCCNISSRRCYAKHDLEYLVVYQMVAAAASHNID
jgi:pyridoxine 4-dehydrogenase